MPGPNWLYVQTGELPSPVSSTTYAVTDDTVNGIKIQIEPVSAGGTGQSVLPQNAVLLGNGANPFLTVDQSKAVVKRVLTAKGSGLPATWDAASIEYSPQNIVPVVVGGTGVNNLAVYGTVVGVSDQPLKTVAPSSIASYSYISQGANAFPSFNIVPTSGGGTGQSVLPVNAVLLGNGTSALKPVPPTSPGLPFISTGPGTAPQFGNMGLDVGSIGLGVSVLNSVSSGVNNTALGFQALQNTTTGSENVALGYQALSNNTTGYNTAVGFQALLANTTGISNTAVGWQALYSNVIGLNVTAIGDSTLINSTGNNNTAVGANGLSNTTTGEGNTAVGSVTLYGNTTGGYNVGIGYNTLLNNTTGGYNVGVGVDALLNNITGSTITALGYNANVNSSNLTNATVLGANALVKASNTIQLGNSSVGVNVGNATGTASPLAGSVNATGFYINGVQIDTGGNGNQIESGLQGTLTLATGTNYFVGFPNNGVTAPVTSEAQAQVPSAIAAIYTGMCVKLSASFSTQDVTIALRKNGVTSGITVTVAHGNTTGSVSGQSVSFAAGDLWDFIVTTSANITATLENITWSVA